MSYAIDKILLRERQLAESADEIQSLERRLGILNSALLESGEIIISLEAQLAARDSTIERLRALVTDTLSDLKVIDEGKWHEYTGDVTLNEDQASCLQEAREFLKQALDPEGSG